MADYTVKVQNRFASLLEPPEEAETKPKLKKRSAQAPADDVKKGASNNKDDGKEQEAATSKGHVDQPVNQVQLPDSVSKAEKYIAKEEHPSAQAGGNENQRFSTKRANFAGRTFAPNRGGNRNERRFDGNDRSGAGYFNNNGYPDRNRNRAQNNQMGQEKDQSVSADPGSAVFSSNAPIPQWEDFASSKDPKSEKPSNGIIKDEFPQVEEFRLENFDSKDHNSASQRNNGGFNEQNRARGGGYPRSSRGGGARGGFRGPRTFSRGGGGSFGGNFRSSNYQEANNVDRGEPVENAANEGNVEEVTSGPKEGDAQQGNMRNGYPRYGKAYGSGGNYKRDYNSDYRGGGFAGRGGTTKRFNSRAAYSNHYANNYDRRQNQNASGDAATASNVDPPNNPAQFDNEGVANGAQQVMPVENNVAAVATAEIGDWNAEVEREEAKRKQNNVPSGEDATAGEEDVSYLSLSEFEALQREKNRSVNFDIRKPGEGQSQFEGMRRLNSSRPAAAAASNATDSIEAHQQIDESGANAMRSNSGRLSKHQQMKLDLHFGTTPSSPSQQSHAPQQYHSSSSYSQARQDRYPAANSGRGGGGGNRRGGNSNRRGGGGYHGDNSYSSHNNSRRYNNSQPEPTFNVETDFPTLGT